MNTIGKRIRLIRKRLNLSQLSFGESVNISNTHVSGIESDKVNPSDSLIKLIAMQYNINEEWLKFGTGPMGPNFTQSAINTIKNHKPEDLPERYKDYPELSVSLNSVYAQEYCKIVDLLSPGGASRGHIPFTYFPELVKMINYLQNKFIDAETEKDRFRIEFLFEFAFSDYNKEDIREENKKAALYQLPVKKSTIYDYLPLIGRAAAGKPVLIDEMVQGYIPVKAKNHTYHHCYLIEAYGDSMLNAGINNGDLVIIRPQPAVDNGDVSLVRIEDEAVIKYFYKYDDEILLKSANEKYQAMRFTVKDNITVIGKIIEILDKSIMSKLVIPETKERLNELKKGLSVEMYNGD